MKRFVNTAFFRMVKTDPNVLSSSVEDEYEAFAVFISEELSGMKRLDCIKALIYTQTELENLLEVSEKKAYRQF
jgi:hypothetical protein